MRQMFKMSALNVHLDVLQNTEDSTDDLNYELVPHLRVTLQRKKHLL